MSEENKNTKPDKLPDVEIDTSKPKKNADGGDIAVQKSKFARWLENFFYHYKWHTAAVAFILIVAIVCTVTMCGREKPDINVIYAGRMDISTNRDGSDRSAHESLLSVLTGIADDYNKDKNKIVNLETFYWLSTEEINALNSDENEDNDINSTMQSSIKQGFEDIDRLMTLKASSQYYVWFISPTLYDYYADKLEEANVDTKAFFTVLDSFATANPNVVYYDDNHTAIKLSSLKAYQNTELYMLPEDTLVILRSHSGVGNKSSKKAFEASRSYIKNLINY
ncbi:MAG: hypothetical protein J6Q67_08330 [Clostridia bacterium]|nr:hypothetical protein [Clostridia bacterium]